MNKTYHAPEPSMEDLLANIRRAINEDAGSAARPQAGSQDQVISGSMRELRVRFDNDTREPASRAGEIRELRDRVSGQSGRKEDVRNLPQLPPAPPKPSGFAELLRARQPEPEPEPAETIEPEAVLSHEDYGAYGEPEPALRPAVIEDEPYYGDPEPEPLQSYVPPRPAPMRQPAATRSYLPAFNQRAPQQPAYPREDETMLSPDASAAAANSFNRLADALMVRATGDRPIEEITRELLRSMLKQWLDDNLPPLVERIVREEIERVARRGPVR